MEMREEDCLNDQAVLVKSLCTPRTGEITEAEASDWQHYNKVFETMDWKAAKDRVKILAN